MPEPLRRGTASDEFFIGYLDRMPPGIARRVRIAAAALIALAIAAALLAAGAQNRPAPSVWEDTITTISGRVVFDPYPRLESARADGSDGTRHVLLTAPAKFGLLDPADYCGGDITPPPADPDREALVARLKAAAGTHATLRGTLLRRAGREMLEVQAIEPAPATPPAPARAPTPPAIAPHDLGEAELRGEIVDPKCFFGAMKPGEGKTHKACAIRCVAGGIAPVLVVRDATGDRCLLLTTADGRPMNAQLLPLVGERALLRGRVLSLGGIEFLRVSAWGATTK